MDNVGIRQPELLHLHGDGGKRYQGGNQQWYRGYFQRLGGCGPTTASHLAWYLARTRSSCAPLWEVRGTTRRDFLALMEAMWEHVTPGMRGVHRSAMFVDGLRRFGELRGVPLDFQVLEVSPQREQRPSWEELAAFLTRMFSADLPVAFLNLDNGGVAYLDSWHWVTLVGLGPGEGYASILDQGRAWEIQLDRWLSRSKQGGALVAAWPQGEAPG